MIKLIRGCRVLRVGHGRVVRTLLVVLILVIAWQSLLSKNLSLPLQSSKSGVEITSKLPNLQISPHVQEVKSSSISSRHQQLSFPGQHQPAQKVSDAEQYWKAQEKVLRASHNINPGLQKQVEKDNLHIPKPVRNQHFLQQNQLNLIDGLQEEDEDEDDDYDDDEEEDHNGGPGVEGKWNGKNMEDNVEDVAIEEEDEAPNKEYELEEVGGDKFKRGEDKEKKKKKKKLSEKKHEGGGGEINDETNEKRPMNLAELIGNGENVNNLDHGNQNKNDINRDYELSEMNLDMGAIEKEFALRRSRVKETCGRYGLGSLALPGAPRPLKYPPTPNYDVFYIDRHEQLAWCPIYKAASTSWLYNFMILGGLDETYIKHTKEQVSSLARRVWPSLDYDDAQQAMKTCLKFMIVRHPFERLVSAYRDKLENTNIGKEHGVDHFYKKYGKTIVAKFRAPGLEGPPANRYSQDMDDPSIPAPKGIEPTFEEFVKYLISTDLVHYSDDHWMPYYLHCTPCILDYDVLAKFETLDRDQNYIIKKQGLEHKIKPTWKHMTRGIRTSDTVRKYFATITKKDLLDLYEKYKLDFELFDYSMDEYLKYVRNS